MGQSPIPRGIPVVNPKSVLGEVSIEEKEGLVKNRDGVNVM